MNWQAYERLIARLKTMDPARFHYAHNAGASETDGCVACQCRLLECGRLPGYDDWSTPEDIQRFLNVSADEAEYLYGVVPSSDWVDVEVPHGADGVAEALHRLARVAARYERLVSLPARTQ